MFRTNIDDFSKIREISIMRIKDFKEKGGK